ncbi:hypothetical protein HMPREF1986_02855, partial [Oribacterium sp. oral taxon 078 str. F0263]|uniref:hypothetical protein n=1 Tax=Oribacterium sp. oral taxon 078 TaxID=652706 RepID=UPI0003ADFE2B
FQSTLPSRGATGDLIYWCWMTLNFNPRFPRGERQEGLNKISEKFGISIHAPLTGSDDDPQIMVKRVYDFNPRSPRGERPVHYDTC